MNDILKRINQLRIERGWSEYELSVKSEIPQSTISSWYRKNMVPTFPSIRKISNAFDITMAQFFVDDNDDVMSITPQQRRLLIYSAKFEPEQLEAIINMLEKL